MRNSKTRVGSLGMNSGNKAGIGMGVSTSVAVRNSVKSKGGNSGDAGIFSKSAGTSGLSLPDGAILLVPDPEQGDSGAPGMNMYLPVGVEADDPSLAALEAGAGRVTVYESVTNKVLYSANFGTVLEEQSGPLSGRMKVHHYQWGANAGTGQDWTFSDVQALGVPGAFTYDKDAASAGLVEGGDQAPN